jgi:hypothetical protein
MDWQLALTLAFAWGCIAFAAWDLIVYPLTKGNEDE